MTQGKKMGRPREGDKPKAAPISVRTDEKLRDAVVAYREREQISLTQAVEKLLRLGLEAEAAKAG